MAEMCPVSGDQQISASLCRRAQDGRILGGQQVRPRPRGAVSGALAAHGKRTDQTIEWRYEAGVLEFQVAAGFLHRVR